MSTPVLLAFVLLLLGANALRNRSARWQQRKPRSTGEVGDIGKGVRFALAVVALPATWLCLTRLVAYGSPAGLYTAHGWNASVLALVTLGTAYVTLPVLLRVYDVIGRAVSRRSPGA